MATDQTYPVILARDAAATLEFALESLRGFPEVIVYHCGSRDRTREICRAYPNVQFVAGDFLGNGRTRNQAASLAEGDWILALDADEYLSNGLISSLGKLELQAPTTAYALDRHTLFMGKDIQWGGWGNRSEVRLYNRRNFRFDDALIGERVALSSEAGIESLQGVLWHQAVTGMDQLLRRMTRRAELSRYAEEPALSPPLILVRASWGFLRSYFFQLGLLEGWRGLVIAVAVATETFFRHMKRYAEVSQEPIVMPGTKSRR